VGHISLGEAIERAHRMADEQEAKKVKPEPAKSKPKRAVAKATIPTDDGMNKTERRYAQHLQYRKEIGEIQEWAREPERLRLADLSRGRSAVGDRKDTFYKPDFRVVLNDGTIEMHEVKGFMRRDAKVHIQLAASLHPYRFVVVTVSGKGWAYEWFTEEIESE